MPVFSTKMIPVNAARAGTGGRPPFGLGGSGGINGPTIAHSSSDTSDLLMPDVGQQAPRHRFVRRS
jgi:hypothetical protein